MAKNLNNTGVIRKMLDGSHRSQTKKTVGYTKTEETKRKQTGDTWTDDKGFIWEQKDGYRIKKGKLNELREELNTDLPCPKCTIPMSKRLDRKYFMMNQMCMDCSIELETKLKISGKYEAYEHNIMLQNVKSWIKDASKEKELLLKEVEDYIVVTENGELEKWTLPYSPTELKIKIENDFIKLKKDLLTAYNATEEDLKELGVVLEKETDVK